MNTEKNTETQIVESTIAGWHADAALPEFVRARVRRFTPPRSPARRFAPVVAGLALAAVGGASLLPMLRPLPAFAQIAEKMRAVRTARWTTVFTSTDEAGKATPGRRTRTVADRELPGYAVDRLPDSSGKIVPVLRVGTFGQAKWNVSGGRWETRRFVSHGRPMDDVPGMIRHNIDYEILPPDEMPEKWRQRNRFTSRRVAGPDGSERIEYRFEGRDAEKRIVRIVTVEAKTLRVVRTEDLDYVPGDDIRVRDRSVSENFVYNQPVDPKTLRPE